MQKDDYGSVIIEKELCPKCLSENIYYRYTIGTWRCKFCDSEFETPIAIYIEDPELFEQLDRVKEDRLL